MHDFKTECYFEQLGKNLTKTTERLSAYLQDPNEKNIHDVRISIRRLDAAFKILPKKTRQKTKLKKFAAKLKKFFEANNKIRDFDIISQKLILQQSEGHEQILQLVDKKKKSSLVNAKLQAKSLKNLEYPKINRDEITNTKLEKRFKKILIKLIKNIQDLMPKVIKDAKFVEELHRLRKECKKLRYVLELTEDPESSNFIKNLKQLQDILGSIHDSDITIDFLKKLSSKYKTDEFIKKENDSRMQMYQKFVELHKILQV
jgi:CHAD domain-containing protein